MLIREGTRDPRIVIAPRLPPWQNLCHDHLDLLWALLLRTSRSATSTYKPGRDKRSTEADDHLF